MLCQLGQGPLQGAQILWGDLTVPSLMAQCSQGSGWALGAAARLWECCPCTLSLAVPSSSPNQPSRPGRYRAVGSVFLGVSALLGGCPSWPGPVLCPGVWPPKPSPLHFHAQEEIWVSPPGGEGRWAGTWTPGTRCSFSFCISAASQERSVQVLPKYSRPIPELPGGASFLNSKADNYITTSAKLRTALNSGQPYPHFSEN